MSARFSRLAVIVLVAWQAGTAAAPAAGDPGMAWLLTKSEPEAMEWLGGPGREALGEAESLVAPGMQRLQQALFAEGPGQARAEGIPENRTLVFISLSLQNAALEALFSAGAGDPNVVFVLRGWEPPDLPGLIARVQGLIAEGERRSEPSVVIQPFWFRAYGIRQVPVFVRPGPEGASRRIEGEISLPGALAMLDADDPPPDRPVGPLHEIAEPDILTVAQARIAATDWEQKLAQARQRAQAGGLGVALPSATQDREYWVRTQTRMKRDIRLPDGRLVVAAGTVVNPLAHMRMRYRYAFFDPASEAHLAVVERWQRQHANLRLVASRLDPLSEPAARLAERLGQPVFPANKTLLERLQITEIPALAEQDGLRMKITIHRPLAAVE